MSDRRRQGLAANPVLVGAVTLLVVLVAVFLSYNANSGLPFVPTYELRARMPNAANLVPGNEVRVGGVRVGVVSEVEAVRGPGGRAVAEVKLKLEDDLDPLPIDSTFVVRPISALGLKYVALTPGRSGAGFAEGATVPIAQAQPTPVEIDEVFNMFDSEHAARRSSCRCRASAAGSRAVATTSTRRSPACARWSPTSRR